MHVPGKANNLIAGSDGAMVTVRDDTGESYSPISHRIGSKAIENAHNIRGMLIKNR